MPESGGGAILCEKPLSLGLSCFHRYHKTGTTGSDSFASHPLHHDILIGSPEVLMFDAVLKHLLSLSISLATLFVPHEKWQREMENQPTRAQRIAAKDLRGWTFETVVSKHTGQIHSFYRYPCTDTASRKTLLLLHGFNTDGSIFFNLNPLAATHTLIAYNFPESTDLYTGSIRDFELLIDDFLSCMNLDTVDLLGNSLGGIIAQFYAAHTDHCAIRNLVLVSTYVPGATKANIRQIRNMADKMLPYPDYKLFYLLTLGNRIAKRLEKKEVKPEDSPLGTVVIKQIPWYRQVLTSMYWFDGTKETKNITCPVLALHGKKDRLVPVSEVAQMEKYLPQTEVTLFDGTGHTLIFDEADRAIREISRKLQSDNRKN
jgi:pimeloyl-ACP methyl ester carboxylesterase